MRRCSSGATPRSCAAWMCCAGCAPAGVESLLVILGPSGAGKSSFLRAGLLPRLRRDDRTIPAAAHRAPRTGGAHRRTRPGPRHPPAAHRPGLARSRCWGRSRTPAWPPTVERLRGWLEEARQVARARLLDVAAEQPAPTLVLPVDQAEELFNADAGPEAPRFLELLAALVEHEAGVTPAMIVAVTIRADRYEPLQIAPRAGRGAKRACSTNSNRCPPPGTPRSSPARPGGPAPPGGG